MTATATAQIDTSLLYASSGIETQNLSNLKPQILNSDPYQRRSFSHLQAAASGTALHRVATNLSGRSRRSDGSPELPNKTTLAKATSVSAVISNANKLACAKQSGEEAPKIKTETTELKLPDHKERPKLVVPQLVLTQSDSTSSLNVLSSKPAATAAEKPAALTTQCLVAKANDELTLKAQVLKSFHELNSMSAPVVHPYNPLRAIRSRSRSSACSPTTGKTPFLWNVAASELANDFAWRKVPVQESVLTSEQQALCSQPVVPPLDSDRHSLSSGKSSLSNPSPVIHPFGMTLPCNPQHEPSSDQLIQHLKAKYEHCRSDCSLIAGAENGKNRPNKHSNEMKPTISRDISTFSVKSAGAQQRQKWPYKGNSSDTELSANDLSSFRLTGISSDMEAARREAETTQNDLLYMLAVYDTIDRRLRRLADQQNVLSLPCVDESLTKVELSPDVRENAFASHLEKLGQFSESISEKSLVIETSLGRPAEVLRLDSERLISEVNTTLSREVRELNAQLDKFETCQRAACLFNVGWNVLEWTVVVILRLIWAIFSIIIIAKKSIRALFF